jgi:hypothetical protein
MIAPRLPTAGTIVDAPPPSIAGAVKSVAEVVEPSSVQPAVTVEEAAPAASQPTMAPQERDVPEGAMRATSPEIQETVEGSGAALSLDAEDGGAQILDLAQVPWAACHMDLPGPTTSVGTRND